MLLQACANTYSDEAAAPRLSKRCSRYLGTSKTIPGRQLSILGHHGRGTFQGLGITALAESPFSLAANQENRRARRHPVRVLFFVVGSLQPVHALWTQSVMT